jgi:hypothetical protein
MLNLYLYSIKIQTDIDQNAVKNFTKKITYFFEILFENFFFRLDWLLNASVREQFMHACYSHKVIKLQLHSICALINRRKTNEKLNWFTAAAERNPS